MTRSQATPASSQIVFLEGRLKELEKVIQKQQFIEDRYEELMLAARRVLRYNGVNAEMCNAGLKAMDSLIQRHRVEIDEMEEKE